MESGVPYLMFKDQVNKKCNQNNLGTIKSSNLCAEINIYTDKDNIGVCVNYTYDGWSNVVSLINDPQTILKLGKNGRHKYESMPSFVDKINDIFSSFLNYMQIVYHYHHYGYHTNNQCSHILYLLYHKHNQLILWKKICVYKKEYIFQVPY